mgnify:CR=1 FL=1
MLVDQINIKFYKLPYTVEALCTCNIDDSHTIIVNDRLSPERQKEVVLHELEHIENDDFNNGLSIDKIELDRK